MCPQDLGTSLLLLPVEAGGWQVGQKAEVPQDKPLPPDRPEHWSREAKKPKSGVMSLPTFPTPAQTQWVQPSCSCHGFVPLLCGVCAP